MKANAPEKIYIACDLVTEEGRSFILEHPVSYLRSVEYTRTDAFIEKACEYLMDYEFNDSPTIADRRKRVDEFKNYMKGE